MRGRIVSAALRALAVAVPAALWPAVAAACPYCALSRDGSSAYVVSAIGMLLLPLGFGAGLVLWLRRRMRGVPPQDPAAGDPPPADEAPRR